MTKPRICIVGSGIGGGIAACELARLGRATVIVVDTDRISDPHNRNLDAGLASENVGTPFNQEITRAFGYGGSSNLWHGVFTRLDEEDWRFIDSAAGCEISGELKALYGELRFAFGALPGQRRSRPRGKSGKNDLYSELECSGKFAGKDFFIQKRPFRSRNALRRLKDGAPDIEFVESAVALYLKGSPGDPSRAEALVADIQGRQQTIKADYFILAMGALETPRIILQGREEGHFPVENENVGRHLVDHPWTVVGEIISKRGWFRLKLSDIYAAPGLLYRIGYRLQEAIDNPKIGSNHCISIKPIFFGDYEVFKEAMKSIISHGPSPRSLINLLRRFRARDILASLLLLACEKFGLGVFVKRCLVFCYLEQPNRAGSCVSLTARKDSSGRRIPGINWIVGGEEADGVVQVKSALSEALSNSSGFAFFPYDDCTLASGSHHAGTMRIGRDALSGVIDKNLRIFGTNNVFACDSSIFPNYGNSNPTLTVAAFALRLARYLGTMP